MSNYELTKAEARELITPVVDNEVTAEERQAFMNYIADHDDVRREYESIKRIKSLIGSRCPYAKAPDSLRDYLKTFRHQSASAEPDIPIYDVHCEKSVSQQEHPQSYTEASSTARRWVFSVAATLVIVASVWGFFNFFESSTDKPIYNVEEYAYEHFIKHNGQFVPPTISTASMGSAEIELARDYDMPMTIPALEQAEFKGVVYKEFVPNFKAPMLEYYLPSQKQYIFIFAFKLDKMKEFGNLVRNEEAIKKCNRPKDFYINNVNGKHVVSWKWDDVWYAAISNHNGNTLASLVKPLQHSDSEN